MSTTLTFIDYLAVLPEILLTALLFIVLGYKSFAKNADGRTSGLITAWGTALIMLVTGILAVVFWQEIASYEPRVVGMSVPVLKWGSMIAFDPIGVVFRFIFLAALLLTSLFSLDTKWLAQPEYFSLLITSTIGFNLMSVATDFVMLVVALETAGISLYMLAGYRSTDERSSEAGMKYFVYGSFATALMMYGLSMLYGLTGRTNIYAVSNWLREEVLRVGAGSPELLNGLNAFIVVAAVLVVAGLAYKVSIVPFHWWAPDVYEGAPSAVAGFTSSASKAAGFALFIRILSAGIIGVPSQTSLWWAMLVAMTVITMGLGNLLAIFQTNIKRMLAYSSVAQAGYVMIALVTFTPEAAGAAMFYLMMYVVTNIAAFGAIVVISNHTGATEMSDFYGLSRRSPYLAVAMLFALLSLGGIPPTAGFFGKFFIFKAAVDAGLWQLALVGILFAFISLYYYLNIIKYIYLYRGQDGDESPIPMSRGAVLAMSLCVAGILYLGIFAGPAYNWTQNAAQWFFTG